MNKPQNAEPIDTAALASAIEAAVADPSTIDALSSPEPQAPAVDGDIAAPPSNVTLDDGSQVSVGGEGGVAPPAPPAESAQQPASQQLDDPALTPPSQADILANQPRVDAATGESMGAPQFQPEPPAEQPPTPEQPTQPTEPEPPAEQPPAEPDISRILELTLGRKPTADDVIQQVDLFTRITSLPESHQQWIGAVLSGQVDPQEYVNEIARLRAASNQPQARDPQFFDDDDEPDPRLAAEYQRLQEQQQQLEQEQARIQSWREQQIRSGAQDAWKEFRDSHPDWSEEEVAALQVHVNNSPLFGPLYNQSGDAKAAVAQTITNTAIQYPYFRDKLLSADSSPSSPQRQNAAAALASNGQGTGGGGRPVAGPTPPPGVAAQQLQQVNPGAAVQQQQPIQQQPVQSPVVSPFTATQPAPELDLTDKSQVTLAMARQIAELTGGGGN